MPPGVGTQAGMLRTPVTIMQPTTVAGIQKFVALVAVWAHVAPVSGSEMARQLEPTNVVMSNVTIRFMPNTAVKPKMRITLGARTLEIVSVINVDEANRELDLVCREVVN